MRISQCFSGATAVTKAQHGDYFLAVNGGISLIKKDGTEKELLQLEHRILDLFYIEKIVYGVGDNGIFVRSFDYGKSWMQTVLPTLGSIWSICANETGTVVTHGNNVLFLSYDFGETWKTLQPFYSLADCKPSIRSILLDRHYVFIGTKVHPTYGGIWRLDLQKKEIIRIKKDARMVASLLKHKQYLISATGTCKGYKGAIEYCHFSNLVKKNCCWEKCESDCQERCYLDLSESDGFLYTTTSQDTNGIGKVSRIFLNEKRIVPCGIIHGHGWRVANIQSEFFVAGLYTSLYSNSELQQLINH